MSSRGLERSKPRMAVAGARALVTASATFVLLVAAFAEPAYAAIGDCSASGTEYYISTDGGWTFTLDFVDATTLTLPSLSGGSCAGGTTDLANVTKVHISVATTGWFNALTITNVQRFSSSNATLSTLFDINLNGGLSTVTMEGSSGNDTFTGLGASSLAGIYSITLKGLGGNDVITGGPYDEWIVGGPGADRLDGGGGSDVLSYVEGSNTGVTATLNGKGSAGDAAGDVTTHFEELWGSPYADVLTGSSLSDSIFGNDGDDQIKGGRGNDIIRGEGGLDTLDGGGGDDSVDGGAGDDRLLYGGGADGFDGGDGTDACQGWNSATGDPLTGTKRFSAVVYYQCEADTR